MYASRLPRQSVRSPLNQGPRKDIPQSRSQRELEPTLVVHYGWEGPKRSSMEISICYGMLLRLAVVVCEA